MHALRRIARKRSAVTAIAIRGAQAIEPKLRHLARGLLERRPILLLIGGKSQARMQRGKPRIRERTHVFHVRAKSLEATRSIALLLRVDKRRSEDRQRGSAGESCLPHESPPGVISVRRVEMRAHFGAS
jgi:hypothetical protein